MLKLSINVGVVCLAYGSTLHGRFLLCSMMGKGTSPMPTLHLLNVFSVFTFVCGVWIAHAYKGKLK